MTDFRPLTLNNNQTGTESFQQQSVMTSKFDVPPSNQVVWILLHIKLDLQWRADQLIAPRLNTPAVVLARLMLASDGLRWRFCRTLVLVDNDPFRLQNNTDHWLILWIQVLHCDKAYSQVSLLTRLHKESWVICHQRCENWMFFSVNQYLLIICWIHIKVLFVNLLRSLKNMQFKNIILQ